MLHPNDALLRPNPSPEALAEYIAASNDPPEHTLAVIEALGSGMKPQERRERGLMLEVEVNTLVRLAKDLEDDQRRAQQPLLHNPFAILRK